VTSAQPSRRTTPTRMRSRASHTRESRQRQRVDGSRFAAAAPRPRWTGSRRGGEEMGARPRCCTTCSARRYKARRRRSCTS
jgi:hypothetical protein